MSIPRPFNVGFLRDEQTSGGEPTSMANPNSGGVTPAALNLVLSQIKMPISTQSLVLLF